MLYADPFLKARVRLIEDEMLSDFEGVESEALTQSAIDIFSQIVSISTRYQEEFAIIADNIDHPGRLADCIASVISLKTEDKQRILELINIKDRFNALVYSEDVAGKFVWEITARTLIYSANRLGEVADDIVNIDRAMKWGFGWNIGPFELWDNMDLIKSVKRMKSDGYIVPQWINDMLASGRESFYEIKGGNRTYFDVLSSTVKTEEQSEKSINLNLHKTGGNIIKKDWSASLIDLGDGVLNVEFHSILQPTLNPIDGSLGQTISDGMDLLEADKYQALVIGHQGANFCAGANLNMILAMASRKDWDSINNVTQLMQNVMQKIRFSNFPVVAAPYGLVLGGGFETIGACDRIVAASESYIGLVEVGVGLIPGAGGNLRMIDNLSQKMKSAMPGAFPVVQKAFETIGFAKVGTSAEHSRSYGYLKSDDISMPNRSQILDRAKEEVLSMASTYQAPEEQKFKLPGGSGRLVIKSSIKSFVKSGKISEHDALIAEKLGYVLTGGSKGGPLSPVSEQYLLDIEREVFVSLCGEQKSIDRIEYMLKKGKPLRN